MVTKEKKKEKWQEIFAKMPVVVQYEVMSYIKYKTLPPKRLASKYSQYKLTTWAIDAVRQELGFVNNERDEAIVEDFRNGVCIDTICLMFDLERSRVSDIINHYRTSPISKETITPLF